MTRSSMTLRAARWSAEHPWRAILLWLAFVAAAVGVSSAITTQETSDADYRLGQSGRAAELIHESGLDAADQESVLITARSGELDPAAARTAADDIRATMSGQDEVARVDEPVWSKDRAAVLVPVTLIETTGTDPPEVTDLVDATAAVQATRSGS